MNFKQKDMILIENYIKKVHIYLGEEFLEISNSNEIIKNIKSGAKSINIKFEYISKKGLLS